MHFSMPVKIQKDDEIFSKQEKDSTLIQYINLSTEHNLNGSIYFACWLSFTSQKRTLPCAIECIPKLLDEETRWAVKGL